MLTSILLDPIVWIYTLVISSLIYCLYLLIHALWLSPLRHLPGPLYARISSRFYELIAMSGKAPQYGCRQMHRYGDIYLLQPNTVSINNPADIRQVLSSSQCIKDRYYRLLRFTGIDSIMSTRDPHRVSQKRRKLGPYFNTIYVSKMEPLILEQGIKQIKKQWDAQLANGQTEVNYTRTMAMCALNIVGRLVFGQRLEALQIDTEGKNTLDWMTRSTTYLSVRALLQLLPYPVFFLLTWPWEYMYEAFAKHVYNSIEQRQQLLANSGEKPVDLLQALMECQDPDSKLHLTNEEIHAESLLLLIGGIDPTAYTLTMLMHLLMLYPECYQQAVQEVCSVFPADPLITYAMANHKLPYLEACLRECMRLVCVPAAEIPRLITQPEGLTLTSGHWLPQGTTVFANMWGSHHNPKYWTDPERFDPARFLKDPRAKHSVFAFGHGTRICMGKHLAWMNMLTIMANVLRDYDLRLPDDYKSHGPSVIDPKTGHPKLMDMTMFISTKPKNPDIDCRLIISKHRQ